MKSIKNMIILFVILFGVSFLYENSDGLYTSMINFLEKNLNMDISVLSSLKDGNLIDYDNLKSLEDSGVSFEGYDFDTTYYPYYGLLNLKEKSVYKQVYANAYEGEDTFVLTEKIKTEDVSRIIESVYNDHPELFWVNTNYSYKYTDDGYCAQVTLEFNELVNDLDYHKSVFERSAKTIINKANTLSTDYEKEKYVHDTIIEMASYDTSSDIHQSAYSTLVNNKTVCAGYAKAFQYIMIELGIPTYYVSGAAQGDHAWNIVKLDDEYYNVDLTWADQETTIYNFFNVSDNNLNETHTRTELSKLLPVCSGSKYSNLEKTYDIVISGSVS